MSFWSALWVNTAFADTAIKHAPAVVHTGKTGGWMSMLPMLVIFIFIFYFLLVRPQSKRSKQQKQMLADLKVGDEILTAGGIAGRLSKMTDDWMTLTTDKDTHLTLQKSSIASILPKGTLESLK